MRIVPKIIFVFLCLVVIFLNVSCNWEAHTCEFSRIVVSDNFLVSKATCTERSKYSYSCECGKAGSDTFEYGPVLSHDFSGRITHESYLVHSATCFEEAEYYYSCTRCGTKSQNTFKTGTCKDHNFNQKIVNGKTRVPNQIYSCTVPLRYYYSCECGAVSDTDVFETEALSSHVWVCEQDEKYLFENNKYYKHCFFCSTVSEEYFEVQEPGSNQNQNVVLFSDVYQMGNSSEAISVESGKTYIFQIALVNEEFFYQVNFSGDEQSLSLNLYEDSDCTILVDPGLYEDLDGTYYLAVSSTESGELTILFS